MFELTNDRKDVFINLEKHGEFFEKIVKDKGNYKDIPLSGVKFGLYSRNDIYDVDNELLVKRDILIKTLVTDDRGVISEKLDIPFGSYYLKEIETLPGYKLDTNIYEFSVMGDDSDNVSIMIANEPLFNELIKGRLVINKVDEYGNKLSGACFKLFDDLNNLIYEGCTDLNGNIVIDNLAYGKYHFYEVSAPFGYLVGDNVYDVNIMDDNSLVEFDVLNVSMPKTSDIYSFPRKLSLIGIGFGFLTLSLTVIYDKKSKDN